MEQVLNIYEQPYDASQPVLCFDERPCQLIDDVIAPVSMKRGQPLRQDYEYACKGTCVLLMAFEPHTGKRFIEVKERRTKQDYALFLRTLAETWYPDVTCIRLVQDNLNTHKPSSFYDTFPAEEAFDLCQRFDMIFTPKHASRLNMAELEFAALSKQSLQKRISSIRKMKREVAAWSKERNDRHATVTWSFTTSKARNKFDSAYRLLEASM
jgi:hypothetical protein